MTLDDVRRKASAIPKTIGATSHGMPTSRAGETSMRRQRETVGLGVDPEVTQALMTALPGVHSKTSRFVRYGWFLSRPSAIERQEVRGVLRYVWWGNAKRTIRPRNPAIRRAGGGG